MSPLNAKLDFLIGCQVSQLAIGSHEFQLNFEGDVNISVQSGFGLGLHGQVVRRVDAANTAETKELYVLLGASVVSYKIEEAAGLTLLFNNDYILKLYASDSGFESYQIWHEGDCIAV